MQINATSQNQIQPSAVPTASPAGITQTPRTNEVYPTDTTDFVFDSGETGGQDALPAPAGNELVDQINRFMSQIMNMISHLLSQQTAQGSPPAPAAAADPGASNVAALGSALSNLVPDAKGKVNEEQVFGALIQDRLASRVGPEAAEAFATRFEANQASLRRSDGYVPVEKAARSALGLLVKDGVVDQETAERVHAEAFKAAQLDDNAGALYDGRGSGSDPTIAVADLSVAIEKAGQQLARFDSGEVDAGRMPLAQGGDTVTPQGNRVDGSNGFLWKPHSESDGNLVVLLPADLVGQVQSLTVEDASGTEIARGRSTGYHNGGREHFRFDQPGKGYPADSRAVVTFNDGSTKTYAIPNPGQRYD